MGLIEIREGRCGLDLSGAGEGPMTGACEHSNESSGSVIGGEFLY
jgi:hypothetical protein